MHSKKCEMRRQDLYKRGRNYPVTCLSYGKNRKEDFKDYFFCHGCDLLESAVENQSKRANRNQKKYMCTGGHSDIIQPTTRKQLKYRPHNNKTKKDENNDSDAEQGEDEMIKRINEEKKESCQCPRNRNVGMAATVKKNTHRRQQRAQLPDSSSPATKNAEYKPSAAGFC
jgi:hypothetical protein